MVDDIQKELRKPFHPTEVQWKPGAVKGERALALAYADLRAYMNRLDKVCGMNWGVSYEPWGENKIVCNLTINGVTRSSTGESTNESERTEIGGTVAEAQAMKRACAMFGLGRYLYNLPTVWADYDPGAKQFTEKAKAKLTNILVQHYRRAMEDKPGELHELFQADDAPADAQPKHRDAKASLLGVLNDLGQELYGGEWTSVCQRNVLRISDGKIQDSSELTSDQIQKLINGMKALKAKKAA